MDKLLLKYRNWYRQVPPIPIKLQIPGWAGEDNEHKTGDKPQPWHCIPFVEASTYGLELRYPFDTECHVCNVDGTIRFEGDFSEENKHTGTVKLPPFMSFAPGHFGMTSCLDLQVPPGYVMRLEPHPRFYTDETYTVPCCIAGHIQTEWWPEIFFVVFKNPPLGGRVIFRKGEAYGQVLIVPQKIKYDIQPMTLDEAMARNKMTGDIEKHTSKFVKNAWVDHTGKPFDDSYKQLATVAKSGSVRTFLDRFEKKKYRGKLVKRNKNEIV